MAATISNISYSEMAGVQNVSITFSNGAAIFARVIRKTDSELIILFAGKLVAISLPDHKCETLCEGVSIR